MSDNKMILELNLALNQDEQKKLLHFLDSELCIDKEDVHIIEENKQQMTQTHSNTSLNSKKHPTLNPST